MNAPRHIIKTNPASGKPLAVHPIADDADIAEACTLAAKAQRMWALADARLRARVLQRVAKRLYAEADTLAKVIAEETGKPLAEALEGDVATAVSLFRFYAERGPGVLRPHRIRPDRMSRLMARSHWEHWHPRGVIAIIAPWNYPVAIAAGGLAAALMVGNAAILKPSEQTPASGQYLVDIIRSVLAAEGFLPDVVQALIGDGATGEALLHAAIDGVIFTGSVGVGRQLRRIAAQRDLWHSLELGGSDAMLVLPGVGSKQADWVASYAVWGRCINAGQACAATKRLLVPDALWGPVLERLQMRMAALQTGAPDNPQAQIGPLMSAGQREVVHGQVQDALARGARCLLGGVIPDGPGYFYPPTLLVDVPPDSRVLQEEVFGPVLPVLRYDALENAIAAINTSPFGLTTSVLGDPTEARRLADQLACGVVSINDVGITNFALPSAPWSGWKASGGGVSHGERVLTDLCRLQVVSENHLGRLPGLSIPFWHFPRPRLDARDTSPQTPRTAPGPSWPYARQLLDNGIPPHGGRCGAPS